MDFELSVVEEAAQRWYDPERAKRREEKKAHLRAGRITEVETEERLQKYMGRWTRAAIEQTTAQSRLEMERPPSQLRAASLVETVGLERVIGETDFLGIAFVELALAVSRFVGRIHIRTSSGRTAGFGTGFMVSPRLLLTNNHVLENEQEARSSEVEFDYQFDRFGRPLPVVACRLEPQTFFLTSKELDFTLVAVAERSIGGIELKRYAWSRLIEEQGKAIHGSSLNIIQHPKGEAKQIVLRSNTLVDLLENHVHYETDTEPGSSGSPVYNDLWEVVALHHSGVPKMENGQYIAADGSIWRPGMNLNSLAWVANEGVRVSSIVGHIKKAKLRSDQRPLREELLTKEPPHPLEVARMVAPEEPAVTAVPAVLAGDNASTWTIPIQITVRLGTPTLATGASMPATVTATEPAMPVVVTGQEPASPADDGEPPEEEAVSIDPDYSQRKGYNPNFLGSGNRRVPLPVLSEAMKEDAAINQEASASNRHLLPYHHYSVVMNKKRKLAYFTAVNIDGRATQKITREDDRWFYDPRIPREEQAGNDVYRNNPLDKGHLVRRLDPAWGSSEDIAKVANDDTFHYTNSSPQHQGFNREATTWAGLEDYILDNADLEDLKVSVFTGPVLSDEDPDYRGVKLPRQYWKVVVMVKKTGKLSATAYLLSQANLIAGLTEEAFAFGAYRTFQVPVSQVEERTGLQFGRLKEFDPIAVESDEALGQEGLPIHEIIAYEDMKL